jgi:hypothetical protein
VTAPQNASVARIHVAGRDYPAVTESSCKTCGSPFREEVEEQLLAGRASAHIAKSLPEEAHLTARNVRDHWANGHLPVHEPTVQALLDKSAEQRGEAIRPAVEAVVEHVDFARRLLSRVRERVVDGEIEPNIRDGLRAAELIARYDSAEPIGTDLFTEAFIIYFDIAKRLMSDDQFSRFGNHLNNNPLLAQLQQEWQRRQQEPCARI